MKLQGRNLSIQTQGDDVKRLQDELRQLGFTINDPAGAFFGDTQQAVLMFQGGQNLPTNGVVDADTAARINAAVNNLQQALPFLVHGYVRQADGTPLGNVTVTAFDRDLRHEESLGQAQTDAQGHYEIPYGPEQFRRAEKESADLLVRANALSWGVLASPILFNAPPSATIDLTVGGELRGLSEYDQLVADILPLLDDMPLADLVEDDTHQDVTFLAGETGQTPQRIEFLIAAHQLAWQTGLLPEAFYGFFRQNLPTKLPALLAQHPHLQRLALQTALQENTIPSRIGPLIDSIVEGLQQWRVQQALQSSGDPARASLGDLLATVIPNRPPQEKFATLYLQQQGALEDFWTSLALDADFTGLIDHLRLTFELAAITQDQLLMIRRLQSARRGDFRASLRRLATRDIPAWVSLINTTVGDSFPPNVPGNSHAEKTQNYAEMIASTLASAFPTTVVARQVANDNLPHRDDLVRFFANVPAFEFGTTPIQRYVTANPDALAGVADREGATQQLKGIERVFKLTPHYEEMQVLLADNLASAQSIATMDSETFRMAYSEKLGEDRARIIHDNATQLATMSLALYAIYGASMDSLGIHVAPKFTDLIVGALDLDKEFPEWKSLFGSLELCQCEHCRSVLSPAAYLVDILNFLGKCPKGPTGQTPLQILLARRADLQEIELSCDNTNTPLPYIDLVNEVLENAIVPFPSGEVWQTLGTAEERRAIPHPTHINPPANKQLKDQVFPWELPFDLPLAQVRLYLEHVGTRLDTVMAAYQGRLAPVDPAKADATDTANAAEYLGLSAAEHQIITGVMAKDLQEFWGYKPTEASTWLGDVKQVPAFLRRSGLTYLELLELLNLRFINPGNEVKIVPPDSCNPDEMTISAPSADHLKAALSKIHRFMRLWRKLGYSMRDLDSVILRTGEDLNDAFLIQLSHIQQLSADLDVPVVQTLIWWGPFDPFTYDTPGLPKTVSLYDQLFNNPAVLHPVDPAFAFGPSGDEIKNHVPALLAALRISADDLALLTDMKTAQETLQLTTTEVMGANLTMENLSQLYRVASLAKALDLSIVDFLSAKVLTAIDPFQSTGHTLRFVAAVRKIGASPFSIEELDYLLRHAQRPASALAPLPAVMDHILDTIYATLVKTDPTGEVTRRLLTAILPAKDAAEIESAIALIADTAVLTLVEEQNDRIKFIDGHFSKFLTTADVADAKIKLVPSGAHPEKAITDKAARFAYVLAKLLPQVEREMSEPLVAQITQPLSEALGLEPKTYNDLLFKLAQPADPSVHALAFLLDAVVASNKSPHMPEPAPAARSRFYRLYTLLSKIALVVGGYAISPGELRWIMQHNSPARDWLDLNQLAVKVADRPFARWQRLDDVFSLFEWHQTLRAETESGTAALFHLFEAADAASTEPADPETIALLRNQLAGITRWQLTAETVSAVALVKNLTAAESYQNERGLLPLRDCFTLAAQTGLSPVQLRGLCEKSSSTDDAIITEAKATTVMQAVQSGYKDGQALRASRPLSDALREKQRSALVAYLLFGKEFRRADDLFGYYLIDVEMSACQLTSRIKQAISAVQLFVQRALMNLEANVAIPPARARLWKWMKNYRVWEANRKVFLYPENWIEPDLRDDKTPFFKDLENELLQDEVTADNVESAFSIYLAQLDEVALLEICGFYHERGIPEIIHVFGRTRGIPHIYYYRRCEYTRRDEKRWTAWEKVDADIEGDHLIPVVYEGRLRLFWAIITQKATKKKTIDKQLLSDWEVQLAWSTYHNHSWSAKRVSEAVLPLDVDDLCFTEDYPVHIEKRNLFFKTKQDDDGGLSISLHVYGRRNSSRIWILPTEAFPGGLIYGPPIDVREYEGDFRIEGCHADIVARLARVPETVVVPKGTEIEGMSFAEQQDSDGVLYLSTRLLFANSVDVLRATLGRFSLVTPHQDAQFNSENPFFFQDNSRAFFVVSDHLAEPKYLRDGEFLVRLEWLYRFKTFYHPYTCAFIKQLNRRGIEGLLNPVPQIPSPKPDDKLVTDLSRQQMRDLDVFERYVPNPFVVEKPYPVEEIDFHSSGAYAQYNWELFFHIPLMLADRLSENQRFEEAQQWFHTIFDPTDSSALPTPQRFWKIRPFFENLEVKHSIAKLLELLNHPLKADDPLKAERDEFSAQVSQWKENPFNPHLIARLRIAAYQKTVVMKYIDNLISWGDQLFRRETIEAINEATQLYVLAAAILGARPQEMPAHALKVTTYRALASHLDAFSNAAVEIEGYLPAPKVSVDGTAKGGKAPPSKAPEELGALLAMGQTLYFCTPQNDMLLGYWDTVADRLFKVRHCMNIDGVVRQLPLFEPPIDPALLVRATAAGLDLSSILNDLNLPLPHYRFATMLQKAVEFCNDVKALGSALLSALEKKDAENLTRLRAGQEIQLLNAVRQNKQRQIEEAEQALAALNKAKDLATIRHNYYSSREFMNNWEQGHLGLLLTSGVLQAVAAYLETGAAVAHILPEFTVGPTSAEITNGGQHIGSSLDAASRAANAWASVANTAATMSGTVGSYHRRQDDWKHQEDLAAKETEQVDQQILGAEIRKAIAENDLRHHDLQIKHAKEVDVQMRSKFTNRELYSWMISQISAVYFQSYQMAYDLAKRAEQCYAFELGKLGNPDASFIQPLYWDSLKKGLLAGEKLHHDLKRMEVAYLDQNKREYELTKHISLAMLDPLALIMLKETGKCSVKLSETLFDMDYAGHYLRRIKSMSLTIPCVTGPYTGVNCTLTLLQNSVRKSTAAPGNQYARKTGDDRFVDNIGAIQSIATSSAQNDSGVFELNFRDERYLPFEGAGAISEWQIELSKDFKQFNYDTISDVILHMRYTAREGGATLKDAAVKKLQTAINEMVLGESKNGLFRLFSLKHEFPNAFYQLLHPAGATQTAEFTLERQHFPYFLADKTLTLSAVTVYLKPKGKAPMTTEGLTLTVNKTLITWRSTLSLPPLQEGTVSLSGTPIKPWTIDAGDHGLDQEVLDDILLLLKYTVK